MCPGCPPAYVMYGQIGKRAVHEKYNACFAVVLFFGRSQDLLCANKNSHCNGAKPTPIYNIKTNCLKKGPLNWTAPPYQTGSILCLRCYFQGIRCISPRRRNFTFDVKSGSPRWNAAIGHLFRRNWTPTTPSKMTFEKNLIGSCIRLKLFQGLFLPEEIPLKARRYNK